MLKAWLMGNGAELRGSVDLLIGNGAELRGSVDLWSTAYQPHTILWALDTRQADESDGAADIGACHVGPGHHDYRAQMQQAKAARSTLPGLCL